MNRHRSRAPGAAALFAITALQILGGDGLHLLSQPLPFFAYPVPGVHAVRLGVVVRASPLVDGRLKKRGMAHGVLPSARGRGRGALK